MSSSYRISLNNWLATLCEVEANTVYDVGGSQEKIKDRVKHWAVKDYLVFDLEQPHADSPKPDVVCDLNIKHQPALNAYRGMADIVFCLEVFDYVYDPMNAFRILYDLTKPGGKCYISFPFMYPTHNPIEDDCLRYTEFGIRKLAKANKFKEVVISPRRPETNSVELLWRSERLRAAKHYDHNVLGWIAELRK